ncbi:MAG TPA: DUF4145 domain-containing protein [Candidatus Saccharimonadales bacterium]|nr:DUF4145 domain-containing protein [Candidatus Saccharimonadales bacterium]
MALDSWWQFGEGMGQFGTELALYQIQCAFCTERGNWEIVNRETKKKPNGRKVLYFDTYKCGGCANFIMVFWTPSEDSVGGHGLHAYRTIPFALGDYEGADYWPNNVTRNWKQAHKALARDDYDAAVLMARSAVQAIVRNKKAKKGKLKAEIDDLVERGVLPLVMSKLAHEVRELANDSAHPEDEDYSADPQDAKDIVEFLDTMLEYVYDLPHKINQRRESLGKPPLVLDSAEDSGEDTTPPKGE